MNDVEIIGSGKEDVQNICSLPGYSFVVQNVTYHFNYVFTSSWRILAQISILNIFASWKKRKMSCTC